MKKQLLFFILQCLFVYGAVNAQNKVWDFGNDETNFPVTSGYDVTTVVDGLTIEPGGSSFGTIEGNSGTWDNGYSSTNRFKFNGSSAVDPALGEFIPTRRYLSFSVDGPVAVKIWFRASGTGTPRALWVTDGVAEVFHFDSLGDTDRRYIEGNYTGGAGTLYVLCANNAFNLYKLEISESLILNTHDFNTSIKTSLQAMRNRVKISNVSSKTKIDVYNLAGALVRSFETSENTEFTLNAGLFIARIKSSEGQKIIKFIVN